MAPPENAIRKAKDFQELGKKRQALDTLYEALLERRTKTWQKPFEELMLRFVDLCMMLQDYRVLKDGLHQYRNFSQMNAPGSLEKVVIYVIDEAEKKVRSAKDRAERFNLDQDLDGESAVLGIMLSTMTEEDDKARSDRKLIVPWLKVLFESYRAVLDILKTNSKLENAYHQTAIRAFEFCYEFKRISEFRKLCETLRNHLTKLTKVQSEDKKLRGWEGWSIESVELHLETRFKRLDVAMQLDLWTEAFRTVEEINSICLIRDKEPKKKFMAKYYEKLTKIFWASDNILFHSYSWLKFHLINRTYNKNMTNEDKIHQSSTALLSALCIPSIFHDERTSTVFEEDDITAQKTGNLTTLIGLNTSPSRKNLIAELVSESIIPQALPEIQQLYEKIEVDFLPLNFIQLIQPNLNFIASHPELSIYLPALEKVIILKFLKQLSKVYKTLKISQFNTMISGLKMSTEKVENIIVRASQNSLIQIRIDHACEVLRFGNLHLESDFIRNQLCSLGSNLHRAADLITPKNESENKQRAMLFRAVRNNLPDEWERNRSRPSLVERRRTEIEKKQEDKIKIKEKKKETELAQERERAEERKKKDQEQKERQLALQLEDIKHVKRTLDVLTQLGKQVTETKIKKMTQTDRQEFVNSVKKEYDAARAKEEERIARIILRVECLVRSFRRAEVPLLIENYQKQCQEDETRYMKFKEETSATARNQYEESCVNKRIFEPALNLTNEFVDKVFEARRVLQQEENAKNIAKAKEEARNRKLERAKKRKQHALQKAEEDRKKQEEEMKRKKEEDRIRKEEEERNRKEEEARRKSEEMNEKKQTESKSSAYVPPSPRKEDKSVPASNPPQPSSRFAKLIDSNQESTGKRSERDQGNVERQRQDGPPPHSEQQGRFSRGNFGDKNKGNEDRGFGDKNRGTEDRGFGDRNKGSDRFGDSNRDRDQGRSDGFNEKRGFQSNRDQPRTDSFSSNRDQGRSEGFNEKRGFQSNRDQPRTDSFSSNRDQPRTDSFSSNRDQGRSEGFNDKRGFQSNRDQPRTDSYNDKRGFSSSGQSNRTDAPKNDSTQPTETKGGRFAHLK